MVPDITRLTFIYRYFLKSPQKVLLADLVNRRNTDTDLQRSNLSTMYVKSAEFNIWLPND